LDRGGSVQAAHTRMAASSLATYTTTAMIVMASLCQSKVTAFGFHVCFSSVKLKVKLALRTSSTQHRHWPGAREPRITAAVMPPACVHIAVSTTGQVEV